MTVLCWLYYDSQDGLIFSYWTRQKRQFVIRILKKKVVARFRKGDHLETYPALKSSSLTPGWIFVGASYNRSSGEAKVWVNVDVVGKENIGKDVDLGTQNNVIMGAGKSNGSSFKGRITQMQVYNLALTQGQIQAIKEQINRLGKNVSFFAQMTKRDKKRLTWCVSTMCICDIFNRLAVKLIINTILTEKKERREQRNSDS